MKVDLPVLYLTAVSEGGSKWTNHKSGIVRSLRVEGKATIHISAAVQDYDDPVNFQLTMTLVDARYRVPTTATEPEAVAIQQLNLNMLEKLLGRQELKGLYDGLSITPKD